MGGTIFNKKNVEKIFLGYPRGTPTWVSPKNRKTCQLEALIRQWTRSLGICCLTLFKSPRQEVFKTPLTLIKAIILTHLVAVQSLRIFKILTILCDVVKILKIPELWTATKCARIIAVIKVRGVWKTSWQGLWNNVKQNIPRVLVHYLINVSSWQVLRFLGGTHVGVPRGYPKNIFSTFFLLNMVPPTPKY